MVPYCYLFLQAVIILWFAYYISDIPGYLIKSSKTISNDQELIKSDSISKRKELNTEIDDTRGKPNEQHSR